MTEDGIKQGISGFYPGTAFWVGRNHFKPMMGEYILYMHDRIFGGIYDDRFLVKPTKSAVAMMPDADRELPYEGAKEMLLVDNIDSREFLMELLTAMYDELPMPMQKKKASGGQHAGYSQG